MDERQTLADAVAEAEAYANEALEQAAIGDDPQPGLAAIAYELRALRLTLSPLVFLAPPPPRLGGEWRPSEPDADESPRGNDEIGT